MALSPHALAFFGDLGGPLAHHGRQSGAAILSVVRRGTPSAVQLQRATAPSRSAFANRLDLAGPLHVLDGSAHQLHFGWGTGVDEALSFKPLRKVVQPDLMLTTTAPLTQRQITAIAGLRGVTTTTVVSTGAVRVGTRAVNAMGVDPSSFRAFTPGFSRWSRSLPNRIARSPWAS